ncbi:MAG: hypothetical protein RBR88_04940 [Candidatus Saccharicenans sp.]|nr:hypothetical protein [Candidatus Saccharicenans sp.]
MKNSIIVLRDCFKRISLVAIVLTFSLAGLKAQDIITLGKPGTEGELVYPRQAQEGPDGNIYVYDQSDAFIKVYLPEGSFLRKIGGKGQGPGEIQRPDGVTFGFTTDGKLFLTEYFGGHPWITVLTLDGGLDQVIKPQIDEFFGVARVISLAGGNFLVEFSFLGQPEKEKDYFYYPSPRELALIDSQGKRLSRLKKTEHITRISYVHDGGDSPIPFTPVFLWCLYDEKFVLFSEGLDTKIQVLDFEGKLIREIETSLPQPEKVTSQDLARWRKQHREMIQSINPGWWSRFGSVIDKYKKSIYSHKPTIWDITRTPQGRFLIASSVDSNRPQRDYWLVDRDGKELVKINTSVWIMNISPNFILIGEVAEDGTTSIKALKRQGKEEDDLLKLSGK